MKGFAKWISRALEEGGLRRREDRFTEMSHNRKKMAQGFAILLKISFPEPKPQQHKHLPVLHGRVQHIVTGKHVFESVSDFELWLLCVFFFFYSLCQVQQVLKTGHSNCKIKYMKVTWEVFKCSNFSWSCLVSFYLEAERLWSKCYDTSGEETFLSPLLSCFSVWLFLPYIIIFLECYWELPGNKTGHLISLVSC